MSEESTVIGNNAEEKQDDCPPSPDIHFEPIVKLPLIVVPTLEEDEEELIKLRAKLFRFDKSDPPGEWKERGTGEVKLLKNSEKRYVRILMRRDKTLKICANHLVHSFMELKPGSGSDKAWVWTTPADFTDEDSKPETLAIRFGTTENAQKFKSAFDAARDYSKTGNHQDTDDVAEKLENLKVEEEESKDKDSSSKPEDKRETSTESQSPKEQKTESNKES